MTQPKVLTEQPDGSFLSQQLPEPPAPAPSAPTTGPSASAVGVFNPAYAGNGTSLSARLQTCYDAVKGQVPMPTIEIPVGRFTLDRPLKLTEKTGPHIRSAAHRPNMHPEQDGGRSCPTLLTLAGGSIGERDLAWLVVQREAFAGVLEDLAFVAPRGTQLVSAPIDQGANLFDWAFRNLAVAGPGSSFGNGTDFVTMTLGTVSDWSHTGSEDVPSASIEGSDLNLFQGFGRANLGPRGDGTPSGKGKPRIRLKTAKTDVWNPYLTDDDDCGGLELGGTLKWHSGTTVHNPIIEGRNTTKPSVWPLIRVTGGAYALVGGNLNYCTTNSIEVVGGELSVDGTFFDPQNAGTPQVNAKGGQVDLYNLRCAYKASGGASWGRVKATGPGLRYYDNSVSEV